MMEVASASLAAPILNPGFIRVMDGAENIRTLIETTSNRKLRGVIKTGT